MENYWSRLSKLRTWSTQNTVSYLESTSLLRENASSDMHMALYRKQILTVFILKLEDTYGGYINSPLKRLRVALYYA